MLHQKQAFIKAKEILSYLRNDLDHKEERQLLNWLKKNTEHQDFIDQLRNEKGLQEELHFFSSINRDLAWKKFIEELQSNTKPFWKRNNFLKYAASLLMILSSFWIANHVYHSEYPKKKTAALTKTDINPGGNHAALILSNGKKIYLDDLKNGDHIQQTGMTIIKTKEGQIIYQIKKDPAEVNRHTVNFNQIETPLGGQYQVILPDGSRVWLNAVSSLRYPTSFSGARQRKVELTGEGYFEIAKDKNKPFLVVSKKQTVEVLGTHFNVNAYEEEPVIKTTLLEGSVKIGAGNQNVNIHPGEQAILNARQQLQIVPVNTETAVSWVNEHFMFVSQDLGSIMRSISRWYNVDIYYKDNISEKKFTGTISRYKNVSEVLSLLELTGLVHFKIEERRIIVMK